jgi:hypothetical protein
MLLTEGAKMKWMFFWYVLVATSDPTVVSPSKAYSTAVTERFATKAECLRSRDSISLLPLFEGGYTAVTRCTPIKPKTIYLDLKWMVIVTLLTGDTLEYQADSMSDCISLANHLQRTWRLQEWRCVSAGEPRQAVAEGQLTPEADADAALDALDQFYNQPTPGRRYEPSEHLK